MEIWKDIKDYPNYQVSNMGRVKSLNYNRTGKERILKNYKNNMGYLQVYLYKEGKVKMYYIHRLVSQAFIPNPNNLSEVNHINEIKTDNCVENLEWCSRKYNTNYGTRTERTQKPILQFTKTGEFIKKWDSATQVERDLGINQGNITKCCQGKYKSTCGYRWCYAVINGFTIDISKLKKVA